ncbi:MAG TPA: hypothetical protein VGO93_31695, partial [Candidatus Xenobia bacterium]
PTGQDSLVVPGQKPDVVVAVAVTDEKAAADSLLKLQAQAAQAVGVEADPAKACEHNLESIGSALEMYGIDHGGHYPQQLAELSPAYLKVMPTCPAAGTDTYAYQVSASPDAYTVTCSGDHHAMGGDKPAYTSATGLAATSSSVQAGPAFKAETIHGATVWVSPVNVHLAYTVHQGYVVAATSVEAIGRVLETLDGQAASLGGSAAFQDGRKHLSGDQGALVWVKLQPTAQHVLDLPAVQAQVDQQTRQGVAALQYAMVQIRPGLLSEEFVKVDAASASPFAKALLASGHLDPLLASYFPARLGNFTTASAAWLYPVVLESMKLFPVLRPQVATLPSLLKMPHGLQFERDILSKTTGAYASASDWAQVLPRMVTGTAPPGGGLSVLLAVHFQSPSAARQAIHQWEADSHLTRLTTGRVHGYKGQALHWALAPDGVLLTGFGPQAVAFIESALKTRDQGQSVADLPDYQSMMAEVAGKHVVGADYVDMTPFVHWMTGMLRPMVSSQLGSGVWALAMQVLGTLPPLRGITYAEVLPDGVHVVGHGASNFFVGLLAATGAAVMMPNVLRARAQAQLVACESNEKHLGIALEMYASEHEGHYPDRLSQLVPAYLKQMPSCPAAGHDSYSATYRHRVKPKEGYSLHCGGHNHQDAAMPVSFPQYTSERGLILTP